MPRLHQQQQMLNGRLGCNNSIARLPPPPILTPAFTSQPGLPRPWILHKYIKVPLTHPNSTITWSATKVSGHLRASRRKKTACGRQLLSCPSLQPPSCFPSFTLAWLQFTTVLLLVLHFSCLGVLPVFRKKIVTTSYITSQDEKPCLKFPLLYFCDCIMSFIRKGYTRKLTIRCRVTTTASVKAIAENSQQTCISLELSQDTTSLFENE